MFETSQRHDLMVTKSIETDQNYFEDQSIKRRTNKRRGRSLSETYIHAGTVDVAERVHAKGMGSGTNSNNT